MKLFLSFFVCFFLLLSCGCTNNDLKTDPSANKSNAPDTNKAGGGRPEKGQLHGNGD